MILAKRVQVEVTKKNRLSESEGDYIETIRNLIGEHGYARVADMATELGMRPPNVTNMLQRLDKQEFVNYRLYRGVTLTTKGKLLAGTLVGRHKTLKRILTMPGMSEKNAEKKACKTRHNIRARFDDFRAQIIFCPSQILE